MCNIDGLHISRNIFKKNDNIETIMATYREHSTTAESFTKISKKIYNKIENMGFNVDKLILEYVVYDSNQSHDNKWINII